MADPFTAAELEAGATMHAGLWALSAPRDGDYDMARAVLAAVAPLIAARVRAEERRQVVDEIAADFGRHCQCTTPDPPCHAELLVAAVRGYATPIEEPDDAE